MCEDSNCLICSNDSVNQATGSKLCTQCASGFTWESSIKKCLSCGNGFVEIGEVCDDGG